MRSLLLVSIAALAFPACVQDISGGGTAAQGSDTAGAGSGSGETGTGSTPSISAAVDQSSVTTDLGTTVKLTYTFASQNGYVGNVTLSPTAMTGWTFTATPSTVALTDGGTATAELTVTVPTAPASLTPSIALGINDGTNTTTVSSAFSIANQLTVNLDAAGATMATHTAWPAKNIPIRIHSGTVIIFHNADTVAHEIHAAGGILHEGGALQAGADYKTAPVTTAATWYCHLHEAGTDSRGVTIVP